MATSGAQQRPPRVLLFAPDPALDRVLRLLREEGHIVEVVDDVAALLRRLERQPVVDVLVTDGMDDIDRARVLVAARERNTWCVHLRSDAGAPDLPSVQREALLAAISLDADDTRIVGTIGLVIAARRSRSAS